MFHNKRGRLAQNLMFETHGTIFNMQKSELFVVDVDSERCFLRTFGYVILIMTTKTYKL